MTDWGKVGAVAAIVAIPLTAFGIWLAHVDTSSSGSSTPDAPTVTTFSPSTPSVEVAVPDTAGPEPTAAPPQAPPQSDGEFPSQMLLSDVLESTDYLSVDGANGYSKPRSVSLKCGYYANVDGLRNDHYQRFEAQLVPFPIPVEEQVTVRYEILLDERKVFDEDVLSHTTGRAVSIPVADASRLTLRAQCSGGSLSDLSWAGFENARFA